MITLSDLSRVTFFAELDGPQRNRLLARAADIHVNAGDTLISEGEPATFFVLLNGEFTIAKRFGTHERPIATRLQGEFFGETPLLLGSPFIVTARANQDCRLIRLEAADFFWLYTSAPLFAAAVRKAFDSRVAGIQSAVSEVDELPIVYGTAADLACHKVRDFMARNRIAFEWHDPSRTLAPPSRTPNTLTTAGAPYVILPGGQVLERPSRETLAAAFGFRTAPSREEYDVTVIGAGPAGLAASVYGASEGLRVLTVEREATGGQAGTSSRIENYLGFPTGLSGDELSTRASAQANRFGAELVLARAVRAIEPGTHTHTLLFDNGLRVRTRAIVLATGVSYRDLPAKSSSRFVGAGLYYGAARTEAPATLGRDIFLIGGGNSAGQAAMFFANYARSVTILIRGESLATSMSQYLINELATKFNVYVRTQTEITELFGTDRVSEVAIHCRLDGRMTRESIDAIFVFIGADAETQWLPDRLVRDEHGFICTGRDVKDLQPQPGDWPLERDPYLLETSIPGIFAAGDVRHNSIKRVAASVGEGSMSIAFVHQHLQATGLPPLVIV